MPQTTRLVIDSAPPPTRPRSTCTWEPLTHTASEGLCRETEKLRKLRLSDSRCHHETTLRLFMRPANLKSVCVIAIAVLLAAGTFVRRPPAAASDSQWTQTPSARVLDTRAQHRSVQRAPSQNSTHRIRQHPERRQHDRAQRHGREPARSWAHHRVSRATALARDLQRQLRPRRVQAEPRLRHARQQRQDLHLHARQSAPRRRHPGLHDGRVRTNAPVRVLDTRTIEVRAGGLDP